ncbi:hypothetical protein CEQ90_16870 [Lewinellaceae bacterium SD302]|nr:hypothetical protein CEQ90_16870 [Lewinellaceae bacterium SD302]
MKPIKEQDELPELLRKMQAGGDGFRQPSVDYFEGLGERIVADERKVRTLGSRPNRRWLLGVAAAAMICLMAVFSFLRPSTGLPATSKNNTEVVANTSWEDQIDELETGEIEEYIDANILDFDLELLAEDVIN